MAAHRFTLTYPRYGTINPIPKDASGNDVEPTPTDKALLALYHVPVTGLFEPLPFKQSALRNSYADERDSRSSLYNGGKGCLYEPQLCDWEWRYQSLQYSLPNNQTDTTTYKKIAWGSSAYYGSGPSLPYVYDSPTTKEPFNGFPASGRITYSICLVLGKTIPDGLTRLAATGPVYDCAGKP